VPRDNFAVHQNRTKCSCIPLDEVRLDVLIRSFVCHSFPSWKRLFGTSQILLQTQGATSAWNSQLRAILQIIQLFSIWNVSNQHVWYGMMGNFATTKATANPARFVKFGDCNEASQRCTKPIPQDILDKNKARLEKEAEERKQKEEGESEQTKEDVVQERDNAAQPQEQD